MPKKKAANVATQRHRRQLVIALGEGDAGEKLLSALEQAASNSGERTLTAWAREVLRAAAGVPSDSVRRSELESLQKRVAWLEYTVKGRL